MITPLLFLATACTQPSSEETTIPLHFHIGDDENDLSVMPRGLIETALIRKVNPLFQAPNFPFQFQIDEFEEAHYPEIEDNLIDLDGDESDTLAEEVNLGPEFDVIINGGDIHKTSDDNVILEKNGFCHNPGSQPEYIYVLANTSDPELLGGILAHEIGHCLGLDEHVPDRCNVMYDGDEFPDSPPCATSEMGFEKFEADQLATMEDQAKTQWRQGNLTITSSDQLETPPDVIEVGFDHQASEHDFRQALLGATHCATIRTQNITITGGLNLKGYCITLQGNTAQDLNFSGSQLNISGNSDVTLKNFQVTNGGSIFAVESLLQISGGLFFDNYGSPVLIIQDDSSGSLDSSLFLANHFQGTSLNMIAASDSDLDISRTLVVGNSEDSQPSIWFYSDTDHLLSVTDSAFIGNTGELFSITGDEVRSTFDDTQFIANSSTNNLLEFNGGGAVFRNALLQDNETQGIEATIRGVDTTIAIADSSFEQDPENVFGIDVTDHSILTLSGTTLFDAAISADNSNISIEDSTLWGSTADNDRSLLDSLLDVSSSQVKVSNSILFTEGDTDDRIIPLVATNSGIVLESTTLSAAGPIALQSETSSFLLDDSTISSSNSDDTCFFDTETTSHETDSSDLISESCLQD